MKRLPIALALAAIAGSALAAPDPALPPIKIGDWTYAGMAERTLMFIRHEDTGNALPSGGVLTVKVRFEEAAPFVRDGFPAMSNVEVDEVDCARMQTRVVRNTLYAERNMTGEAHELAIRDPEWRTEEKGSLGAGILVAACGKPLEA